MSQLITIQATLRDEQKSLQINESQIQNLRSTKKAILAGFGYQQSHAKEITLNLASLYENQPGNILVPIFNELDYKFVVEYLLQFDRPFIIYATVSDNVELKKRQAIQKLDFQIEYDENGSVILGEGQLNDNIPRDDLKYRGNEVYRCYFCNKNTRDKAALKKCGGIYGPFRHNKFSHLNCLLWCCEVFIDEEGSLMQQIQDKRGPVNRIFQLKKKQKCCYCKNKGAGLQCNNPSCQRKMHYECAQQRCYMNWQNFLQLCHVCRKKQNQINKILNKKAYQFDRDLSQKPSEKGEEKADSYLIKQEFKDNQMDIEEVGVNWT